jgi:hypothetical protein
VAVGEGMNRLAGRVGGGKGFKFDSGFKKINPAIIPTKAASRIAATERTSQMEILMVFLFPYSTTSKTG